ncbi:MAG: hypothetical protein MIO87_02430 [Methanomassiliicoccales archaeon]|nr:hypothetical protein [Methanomassiliicoccales archaeon]TFG55919.1 MAG: hypothetical protein E4H30_05975 [Methanomassiliicoccus sp.]
MDEKYPTKLTKGSHYRLTLSLGGEGTMEMEGEFVGYIQYGSDMALMLRLDGDAVRVVPSRSVLFFDILDFKDEKDDRPKENGVYFG